MVQGNMVLVFRKDYEMKEHIERKIDELLDFYDVGTASYNPRNRKHLVNELTKLLTPKDTGELRKWKVGLFDKDGNKKSVETHESRLLADASGRNWELLTKGNSYILESTDEPHLQQKDDNDIIEDYIEGANREYDRKQKDEEHDEIKREADKQAEKALKNYQYRIFYGENGKDNGVLGILRKYSAYTNLDKGNEMWEEICDLTRLHRKKFLTQQSLDKGDE